MSYSRTYGPTGSKPVTPHDTTPITSVTAPGSSDPAGFIVGADGDVAMIFADGSEDTWPALAGIQYAARFTHIKATGTTATGIHALFQ